MSVVTWGDLRKNQIDPEKIEEAINRIIAAHNANEAAHLGPGQSLQSHKASEIIDHVVASIVNDKIRNKEIGIEKLFSMLSSVGDIGVISDFQTFEQHLVGSGATTRWIRRSHVRTGSTINSIASVYELFSFAPGFSGSFRFDFRIYFDEEFRVGAEAYIKIGGGNFLPDTGNTNNKCFGLRIEMIDEINGIYRVTGFVRRFTTLSTTVLSSTIKATETHTFTVTRDVGSPIFNFYLNDVFVGSVIRDGMTPFGTTEFLTHSIKNIAANDNRSWLVSVGHKLWDY